MFYFVGALKYSRGNHKVGKECKSGWSNLETTPIRLLVNGTDWLTIEEDLQFLSPSLSELPIITDLQPNTIFGDEGKSSASEQDRARPLPRKSVPQNVEAVSFPLLVRVVVRDPVLEIYLLLTMKTNCGKGMPPNNGNSRARRVRDEGFFLFLRGGNGEDCTAMSVRDVRVQELVIRSRKKEKRWLGLCRVAFVRLLRVRRALLLIGQAVGPDHQRSDKDCIH
ncbi:uncharacterized protein EI90DRAFT_3074827 [Cantharellus anzutake]|uniref:uncharacterized protein n=1 Tax=Cantharellus anzutake TaxID=1750568 RepID=UPI001905B545|nr:uncharacterized protein EI90DRAFT_3074827 [Cantharellus anzutake]KAF8324704.1 hypothetical protein EI90DRAFT_3074827 [Cantharellus anzutake]